MTTADVESGGQRVVFLLGAGASMDAGLPDVTGLTSRTFQHFARRTNSHQDKMRTATLAYVISALQLHSSKQGRFGPAETNIERVVSAVEMLTDRNQLELSAFVAVWDDFLQTIEELDPPTTDWRSQFPQATAADLAVLFTGERFSRREGRFLDLHQQLLLALRDELTLTNPEKVAYLNPLVRSAERRSLTVATLNYDLTVEMAAQAAGVACDTGIRDWANQWELSWPSSGIKLLKLHGSIDWNRDVAPTPLELGLPQTVPGPATEDFLPFVIYGRNEKLRSAGPFLDLRAELISDLRHASHLVVIGYGCGDEHINELITRWMNTDAHRKAVFVDPSFPRSWATATGFHQTLLTSLQRQEAAQIGSISQSRLGICRETAASAMERVTSGPDELDQIVAESINSAAE